MSLPCHEPRRLYRRTLHSAMGLWRNCIAFLCGFKVEADPRGWKNVWARSTTWLEISLSHSLSLSLYSRGKEVKHFRLVGVLQLFVSKSAEVRLSDMDHSKTPQVSPSCFAVYTIRVYHSSAAKGVKNGKDTTISASNSSRVDATLSRVVKIDAVVD